MTDRASLVQRIVEDLRRNILEGKLRPGQRLPAERRLCALFDVGRTTVREALQSLAVQGLVVRTPRGAVVTDPAAAAPPGVDLAKLAARASVRDLYEVRKLLEVRIARWAALRATPVDIERLRRTVDADGGEADGNANPNVGFHDALVAAAHNPVLSQLYASSHSLLFRLTSYWKLLGEAEVRTARARRHEMARLWHRHILRAIEQRDPEEAGGAMFQHLDMMEKDLLSLLHVPRDAAEHELLDSHPLLLSTLPQQEDDPARDLAAFPE